MKLFERHPFPWKYEHDYSVCGNGGGIDVILDANKEVVGSSYWINLDNLWDMYFILTWEQEKELGAHQDGEIRGF